MEQGQFAHAFKEGEGRGGAERIESRHRQFNRFAELYFFSPGSGLI